MAAAFDKDYVKRLDGNNIKVACYEAHETYKTHESYKTYESYESHRAQSSLPTRWEMVELLREDIRRFREEKLCSRVVVLWAASTEIYVPVDKIGRAHV